jgi:hypothetical protein
MAVCTSQLSNRSSSNEPRILARGPGVPVEVCVCARVSVFVIPEGVFSVLFSCLCVRLCLCPSSPPPFPVSVHSCIFLSSLSLSLSPPPLLPLSLSHSLFLSTRCACTREHNHAHENTIRRIHTYTQKHRLNEVSKMHLYKKCTHIHRRAGTPKVQRARGRSLGIGRYFAYNPKYCAS